MNLVISMWYSKNNRLLTAMIMMMISIISLIVSDFPSKQIKRFDHFCMSVAILMPFRHFHNFFFSTKTMFVWFKIRKRNSYCKSFSDFLNGRHGFSSIISKTYFIPFIYVSLNQIWHFAGVENIIHIKERNEIHLWLKMVWVKRVLKYSFYECAEGFDFLSRLLNVDDTKFSAMLTNKILCI